MFCGQPRTYYLCEKYRNEKYRNMENPFKFGVLVDNDFFTDCVKELQYIGQFLHSENHLILISPRRYGKSSLVRKAVRQTGRPCVYINLQQVTSIEDFSAMIIKEVYKLYPWEKIKHILASLRIVPVISSTPTGDQLEVSFNPQMASSSTFIEDALAMLERVSTPEKKLIVVLDEFQELLEIEKNVDKKLRAVMQEQKGLNYIFLGSQESMMTDIFERVKSPFYHFGQLMHLGKIPYDDFFEFIKTRMKPVAKDYNEAIAKAILDFTGCHPYYTQQLSARCWEVLQVDDVAGDPVAYAINDLVNAHDLDFERIWLMLNRTSRRILQMLSLGKAPYQDRNLPASTSYSALKKLMKDGYVIRTDAYEIEDPFFRMWIRGQQQ